MKANKTIGTFAYDGLIIDGKHSLDVKSITITVDAGTTYTRGTLIGTDGKIFGGTDGQAPDCILTDEIVGTGETAVVTAYKSGNFNKNALIVASAYSLKDADIENMRKVGLFVESVMD